MIRKGDRFRDDILRSYNGGTVVTARAIVTRIGILPNGKAGAVDCEPGWYVCTVRERNGQEWGHIVVHNDDVEVKVNRERVALRR